MTILTVMVLEGSRRKARTYARFPVRVGRHVDNECRLLDPGVSRFHAVLDVEDGELVVRDLDSRNGTLISIGDAHVRILNGGAERLVDGELKALLGNSRLDATLAVQRGCAVRPATGAALREGAFDLLSVCDSVSTFGRSAQPTADEVHVVLSALFQTVMAIRATIHSECASSKSNDSRARAEVVSALLQWTQATSVALRLVEHGLEGMHRRGLSFGTEAREALDSLLGEVLPDRIASEGTRGDAEAPKHAAIAIWGRYALARRNQAQTAAVLSGDDLSSAEERNESVLSRTAPVSERRLRARVSEFLTNAEGPLSGNPPVSG